MKNCTRCNGKGTIFHRGFVGGSGTVYPDEDRKCSSCQGSKVFPEVNLKDVLMRIIAKQGKNKGRVRASFPSPLRNEGIEAGRAYFVWRLARFHGGRDMTMPVVADMIIGGDPYREELDRVASEIAKLFFGTDLAAALVWGRALGFEV
jgi:hypothetical protein